MRVHRSVQFLTILTTLAACSGGGTSSGQPDATVAAAPAAAPVAAPVAAPEPSPSGAISVGWDSGPLDLAYRRERGDMDARHTREIANRHPTESVEVRVRRQDSETKTLELRYTRGKAAHSRTLPGADR